MNIEQISGRVGGFYDTLRRVRKYTAMVGYCRGNRLTLFKVAFSARFFVLTRPFRAYMYNDSDGTIINGSFRFSIATKIVAAAWILNDFVQLIAKLQMPIPKNFIGHIAGIVILPIVLLRTVWRDKKLQQNVMDFMRDELGADIV